MERGIARTYGGSFRASMPSIVGVVMFVHPEWFGIERHKFQGEAVRSAFAAATHRRLRGKPRRGGSDRCRC